MKHKACYPDPKTGFLYRWPVSAAESKALRLPRFTDVDGCRVCDAAGGLPGPKIRYTEGAVCVGCLHRDGPRILAGWRAGSPDAPPVVVMSREAALAAGVDYFVGGDSEQGMLCHNGPHLRLTHIATGRCLTCQSRRTVRKPAPPPSPRKLARRAGHRYYVPTDPCPDCGQRAERDVVTNRCTGCVKVRRVRGVDGRATEASRLMAEAPDLVVSRRDAKAFGFAVYRTGAACLNGHAGWRYVSTGGCIDCLRGR